MFKHILVPLDGSGLAESALPAAAFLAEKLSARVTLIHVIEKNAPREIHGQPHLRTFPEADAYLGTVKERWFPKDQGLDCHVHTSEVDDVARSIVEHTGEMDHDLVVMCSHGRGRAHHLFLGSIAQSVISLGSIPVLMTHPDTTGAHGIFSCRTILVPIDSDPDHIQSLPVAKALAESLESSLHLTMVINRFGTLSGPMAVTSRFLPGTTSRLLDLSTRNAGQYVEKQLKELLAQGFQADGEVLRGDPATVIAESARKTKADIIVLATHGRSGMEAFWAGSVTHKLCSLSKTPLLLIPLDRQ
ncbi:MAG: universal stress protein [Pseudomonadota bacterium]